MDGLGLLSESGFSGLKDWQDSSDGSGSLAIPVGGVRVRVGLGALSESGVSGFGDWGDSSDFPHFGVMDGLGLLSESGFSGLKDWQDSSDGSGSLAIPVGGVRVRVAAGGSSAVKRAGGIFLIWLDIFGHFRTFSDNWAGWGGLFGVAGYYVRELSSGLARGWCHQFWGAWGGE